MEEEVKVMQGQLADYNLMVDKSHTNSDPEEIEKEYKQAKTVNVSGISTARYLPLPSTRVHISDWSGALCFAGG